MAPLRQSPTIRALRMVFAAAPGAAALPVLANVGLALLGPAIALTTMRLTDAIVARAPAAAARWVAVELALVVVSTVLGRLRTDARALVRGRVELEARLAIAGKAAALDLAQLEDTATRDRLEAACAAAGNRPLSLVAELLTVLQSVLSLGVYALVLARFNAWALLLLLAAAPGVAAELWSSRVAFRDEAQRLRERRRLGYFLDLLFSETHAAENRNLGLGRLLVDRARALGDKLTRAERSTSRRFLLVVIVGQIVPPIVLNGCYLGIALATVRGSMTLGGLMLYGLSINAAQRLSQTLLYSGRTALESWPHVRALFDFLDLAPARPVVDARAPVRLRSIEPGLCLENVGFRYPGAEAWAVRHVSLRIRPGDFVAIIGGNGCGKTTLFKILTGLYTPTEGRVTLDGLDLAEHDPEQLRRRFAVVFQEFARYGLTVRDNIAVALPDDDPAPLDEALRQSGADEVVARLPAGLATELLPGVDDGTGLSGGQWQRIALARGLARASADHLVLDEPTAALDVDAELKLLSHLRTTRKTVILVTHRLSTLQPSDTVVLLERGRQVPLDRYGARIFANA